jgi:general stress protein YciG
MQGSRQNRGFASMNTERQREIARKGGRAAHEKGTAHQFTSDEARAAGRKGGERVSRDRNHMAEIGRMGGRSSAGRRSANKAVGAETTEPNPGTEVAGEVVNPT